MKDGFRPGVAIVGCGLVGRKRAQALGRARLVACADIAFERSRELAATVPGAYAASDWRELVGRTDVDIVVVSATNDVLAEVTKAAILEGKHVLVEKPAARSVGELDSVIEAERNAGVSVRVGFNHRYHPALQKAHELISNGEAGELMFIRGRYGHGGRLGYEKEWRADPLISGGGELLDQGIHLIDLSRWFLGDFPSVNGIAQTAYWDMPVEDNG
ncbi:MAG: Gfo/Idh/MocA family oxidoreductase, partial [Proteobacteria bacterium]|nr:Gfo/Idh/MocA family oxidoreductase [Pseudomonadota bacterium]